MDFNGKIAIVTGGSSGIGKATVQLLLKQGAKVIVLDLKPIDINVNKETLFYYDIDVTDENQVSSLIRIISEKFNLINILINSAGVTARNAFDQEVSEYELWKKVLEVNLNGTYLVSREVVKVMIEQNHGSIVNLSSIMGQVVYPEYLNSLTSPYPISKGGIVQYTKNLASFVGNKNIRVNCVSPAFIYTDLTKNILDDEFIGTKLKDQHPMKRFGTPEEVAETICFLASDKASFITGVDLPCDGGYLIL
jgi:NAD(P)-dependent dehydrogenase (short-subunit alcohol dehydrogenase family)|tara:strand:+ start:643 stop:1392 length:750 start_codon:yes stop_codon:yes gene_type:complete